MEFERQYKNCPLFLCYIKNITTITFSLLKCCNFVVIKLG